MAKAEIFAGACGYHTTVIARMEDKKCTLTVQSDCKAIQRLGEALPEVNPYQEYTFRREGPLTLKMAQQYCSHTACPVPSGILKAIEVEAGLNLPVDPTIHISKGE